MGRKKSKPEWQADALQVVNALKGGGVVVHPTDTVWGLAANAKHPKAVSRIFEIKQRPSDSTLLMLVDSPGMVEQYLPNLPDSAWELMEVSDRPVTVIAPCSEKAKAELAPGLVAEDGTLAVRWAKDEYVAFLIRGIGGPLASTSANLTGQPTPASFQQLENGIKEGADIVANHRRSQSSTGEASMIVKFDAHDRITVIRS